MGQGLVRGRVVWLYEVLLVYIINIIGLVAN